ncbi:ABC transporter ATP-binding protein [Limibaculum sp. FT325]|uniref:ABC transporter ATP-binding protein n=1 Tax=Thermohalobaculum sediminis TaxID=2939436 RepID=UPI0020BEB27D|nr:ABC transporter ATP-binding protein [Limibaculum sediminis]MCL5776508.1 ABC transporter ATP-binding protein [Limibaculum sediminis]
MSLLEARSVTRRFGGLTAVNAVDFRVETGEIVGLIGPNGAGKTTFFNLISGFLRPDEGDVLFDGHSILGHKPSDICKRGMTRTFQIVKPFPEMTVTDNVLVGAFNHHGDTGAALAKARSVIELVGLGPQAGKLGRELTVAGRKRVELAKALATEPKLMLLDEVMAGLTPSEVGAMIEVLGRVRDAGVTMVIVEHVMQVIMNLSDRIYVLHHGEAIAEGPPREIVANPRVMEAYLGESFVAEAGAEPAT